MAMTGRQVSDGLTLHLIAMGSLWLEQNGVAAAARAQTMSVHWGAPLVSVLPQKIEGRAILTVALLRVRVPAEGEGMKPSVFTISLAFVTSDVIDAFIPDEVLAAVDWRGLTAEHAVPLDEGQRNSGRHPAPANLMR